MKLSKLIADLDALVTLHPELLDAPVLQQSCFDEPYVFGSANVYTVTEHYDVDGNLFVDPDAAQDKAEDEDVEQEVLGKAVVIEAF